jgi:4-hydroxy-3-methylbut-2-enyl diphosphate reductase
VREPGPGVALVKADELLLGGFLASSWAARRRLISGVSTPSSSCVSASRKLVQFFRDRGTQTVETFGVMREDVRFMLPKVIRQELGARAG